MTDNDTSPSRAAAPIWPGLAVGLVAVAGSLWLSIGMGLKACPLCFYQRTFAMAVVGVLAVGLVAGAARSGLVNLLALPAAFGGLFVAGYHVYLEWIGKLECPDGIWGIGSSPQQSLAALAILAVVLGWAAMRDRVAGRFGGVAPFAAVALGALFAWGAIASVPPPPPVPSEPYKAPPDVCRPPYRSADASPQA